MQQSFFSHPVLVLKLIASIMYVTMGSLIAAMPQAFGDMLAGITPMLVNIFAGLLIVYGVYRFYRVIREYREITTEANDQNEA